MAITSSEYLVELTNLYESKNESKITWNSIAFGESKLQRYKRKLNYLWIESKKLTVKAAPSQKKDVSAVKNRWQTNY
jgi:hypothetical protein